MGTNFDFNDSLFDLDRDGSLSLEEEMLAVRVIGSSLTDDSDDDAFDSGDDDFDPFSDDC